jgi:thiosulfate/3-mercaptopyruvate sulfurtransferase
MPSLRLFCFVIAALCMTPVVSLARDINPFVSADWLGANAKTPGLILIDIRSAAEYKAGHIPGSLHVGFDLWTVNKNNLLRELSSDDELLRLVGLAGIKDNSKVVVVGKGESDFDRADAIRVAWTLLVAGIKNVSVLDGGFPKWLQNKKPITTDSATPSPGEYKGKINASTTASKPYLLSRIGKSIILDARTPEVYFGVTVESFAPQPGHIRSALNLPAPWAYTKDGLLKSHSELESMADAVIGAGNKSKGIVVYCGVGVYASVWSYILTEALGYEDVKVYDGSMQEWIMDPAGPISVFGWK